MYSDYARLRDEMGLTDYAVAQKTGVGRSTLSDWKRGIHVPGPDNLKKIADFFNVSVDYLLSGNDSRSDPGYVISDFEYQLILAYRKAGALQEAVDKILNLEYRKKEADLAV